MIDYTVVTAEGARDRRGSGDDLREDAAAEGAFAWVEFDAADADALAEALHALGMDRFGTYPAHAVHPRPKVEVVDESALLLVKTVWYIEATRQVETGDLAIFTDGRSLVTVRRGVVDPVPHVRERLRDDRFRSGGVVAVVHALFDAVVEQYDGAVEDLTDDVSDLERAVFSGQRVDRNQEIYFLIRETLEFQNAVRPLIPFAHNVRQRRAGAPLFDASGFGEVAGHLIRVDSAIETCMSLLTTVLTAHQGQIGTWQNEDTKKISAWAAIAIAPTIISGIYGMNFDDMPELHWAVGYPLALVAMVVVCMLLYRGFKRNGWLLRIDVRESQWEGRGADPPGAAPRTAPLRGGSAPPALPAFVEHHSEPPQSECVEPMVTVRGRRGRAPISVTKPPLKFFDANA
ncbi:magnesium transporter [Glycomyces sambucus]|uniref:Magnesium transporter n=1 Tax=Glycomyces sambucus TaxID=380244 RepID=A0A1G9KAW6_9ACTN|nr:CorA family divalent cation transporter [Glycomyces sambucus]SDL46716.1 magnesium transporter [Glycomyces sambucus]